jgi:hypothetical protein
MQRQKWYLCQIYAFFIRIKVYCIFLKITIYKLQEQINQLYPIICHSTQIILFYHIKKKITFKFASLLMYKRHFLFSFCTIYTHVFVLLCLYFISVVVVWAISGHGMIITWRIIWEMWCTLVYGLKSLNFQSKN